MLLGLGRERKLPVDVVVNAVGVLSVEAETIYKGHSGETRLYGGGEGASNLPFTFLRRSPKDAMVSVY